VLLIGFEQRSARFWIPAGQRGILSRSPQWHDVAFSQKGKRRNKEATLAGGLFVEQIRVA
jgi:hypothetical protein